MSSYNHFQDVYNAKDKFNSYGSNSGSGGYSGGYKSYGGGNSRYGGYNKSYGGDSRDQNPNYIRIPKEADKISQLTTKKEDLEKNVHKLIDSMNENFDISGFK